MNPLGFPFIQIECQRAGVQSINVQVTSEMTVDFKLQFGPFWQFLKKADPKPQFFLVDNEPTRVSIYSNRMPASRGTVNGWNCEMGLQVVVNGVRNNYKCL